MGCGQSKISSDGSKKDKKSKSGSKRNGFSSSLAAFLSKPGAAIACCARAATASAASNGNGNVTTTTTTTATTPVRCCSGGSALLITAYLHQKPLRQKLKQQQQQQQQQRQHGNRCSANNNRKKRATACNNNNSDDNDRNNNNNNNNELAVKENNRRNSAGSSGARMWLRIVKKNIVQFARKFRGSASLTQKENGRNRRPDSGGSEVNRNDANDDKTRRPVVPPGGPLVQQTEVSTSQIDFFRMLDEKIENGPDFDETDDSYSILNLLKSPRAKSLALSTLASLPQTEAATTTTTTTITTSSTSVAGSGGAKRRPSSTPITIKRSSHDADKIDGISSDQRHHHHNQGGGNGTGKIQTANLPKHLLEPIAQSPKSYTSTRTSPPDQDEGQSSSTSSSSSSSKRSSTTATRTSPQQQQQQQQQQSSQSGGCDFGVKIRGRLKGAELLEQCAKESRLAPECDRPVPMVYPYRPDQDSRTYERIHGTSNSCDFAVRIRGRATGAEALEQAIELQQQQQRKRNSSASSSSSSSSSSTSSSSRSSAVSYRREPPENPLVPAFDEKTLAMQRDAESRRQRHRNHKL
uniref:Uncharacterized protein n=1 Tax=Trichogramma kaykai TaxID=54128 RepID=A0ABD2XNK6_9HYME